MQLPCFFKPTATTQIYTLSLHDALPISSSITCASPILNGSHHTASRRACTVPLVRGVRLRSSRRSEEHTSELQSRRDLVCRLLLEKKKKLIIIKEFIMSRFGRFLLLII